MSRDLPALVNENLLLDVLSNYVIFDQSQLRTSDSILDRMVKDKGYLYLSKMNFFCGGRNCKILDDDGIPFTWDSHHLSIEFAIQLGRYYEKSVFSYLAGRN